MAKICEGCGCIPHPNTIRWYALNRVSNTAEDFKALCKRCADKVTAADELVIPAEYLPKES